jgi:hypothetical protein
MTVMKDTFKLEDLEISYEPLYHWYCTHCEVVLHGECSETPGRAHKHFKCGRYMIPSNVRPSE